MTELAALAFAAESGRHLVALPSDAAFRRFRRGFDERAYRASLATRGIRFLARGDPSFPPRLRGIHDPPLGLFVRGGGDAELLGLPSAAIVGARSCSAYGAQVARACARELAAAGVVVVSGMARGIDGHAHRGALEAGAPTVAVLGCGIDRDYPAAHRELASAIRKHGLVVSEYPPGVEPAPWRFPARNRIVAGLALAVVVVEARERSGALITADFALEEGREVLAVPGEITSGLSKGTNALLRLGATPLADPADALEVLGVERPRTAAVPAPDGAAGRLLGLLRDGPAAADELARLAGLPAAAVTAALVELELAGHVAVRDGFYRTTPSP